MADTNSFSPLSIGTLNRLVREHLEGGFPLCWVAGEISNLTLASSGHAYFTLKDEAAQVRCVMFRGRNQLLGWRLANGQHVEARVLVTLYEARGDFQLNVETMRRAGVGNLFEKFQQLKAKLETEGLFDAARKRPLPSFPRRIGIITSPQAAALRDVLSTLARRAPQVEVIIFPTPVQGDGSAAQIAAAIDSAGSSRQCEALIVCRGGGSMEDLWAFNEEIVARAIAASPLPVVSGIGHETDFTIADFVADLRAPTPTAAAEIIAPERERLLTLLGNFRQALRRQLARSIEQRGQQLDALARRLTHPADRLARQGDTLQQLGTRLQNAHLRRQAAHQSNLDGLAQRLTLVRPDTRQHNHHLGLLATRLGNAWQRQHAANTGLLARLASNLDLLDPQAVLGRGYALVQNSAGQILRDAEKMEPGQPIHVYLARGRIDAEVVTLDRAAGLPLPSNEQAGTEKQGQRPGI